MKLADAKSNGQLNPAVPAAANGRLGAPPVPRLRALVLLGGSVNRTSLHARLGRGVLELPLETGLSLMDQWRTAAAELAQCAENHPLAVRVLMDRGAVPPDGWARAGDERVEIRFERDPFALRGTGGVLRDLASGYEDEDRIVVASAAQVLTGSLAEVVAALAATGGETAVVSHRDGTPCGVMLIRCGCLGLLPEIGFVDFKEQGLPMIAQRYRVAVKQYTRPVGLGVRTRADYIAALRWRHQELAGQTTQRSAFAEESYPAFGVVEAGAEVNASASIHDSVVLRGAKVEREAVLVRSVVGPGIIIRRGRVVVDEVIARESGRTER